MANPETFPDKPVVSPLVAAWAGRVCVTHTCWHPGEWAEVDVVSVSEEAIRDDQPGGTRLLPNGIFSYPWTTALAYKDEGRVTFSEFIHRAPHTSVR